MLLLQQHLFVVLECVIHLLGYYLLTS
ncbi:Protein of unknown function [Lactobacillus acidophilus DSM 9126]|nr:Protein of unknown function [Lactobacillus acidophilus DSM 20079 = JCM 1132 = NBRC 13951 = CIP 76.13]CDF70123.1 Protein of unknown function [Lactobacillus acidophilus CIRM-BIA 442]CDF71917.1 Protein of unknown function [Lactobacillus acidophilus CIRM-BIA 445]CDF73739.1 Protein of unknown function [Lactobacillus acidophilus DSM 9126]CDF75742.1 Protein of unknown function [Lactobacillus acidophilus DSM 20242]